MFLFFWEEPTALWVCGSRTPGGKNAKEALWRGCHRKWYPEPDVAVTWVSWTSRNPIWGRAIRDGMACLQNRLSGAQKRKRGVDSSPNELTSRHPVRALWPFLSSPPLRWGVSAKRRWDITPSTLPPEIMQNVGLFHYRHGFLQDQAYSSNCIRDSRRGLGDCPF